MTDLRTLARQLGGEFISGGISCPGPGHSERDRSLRVFLDHQAPDGFRVHTWVTDWRVCRDYVRDRLGISSNIGARKHDCRGAATIQPVSKPDDAERTRHALPIFDEACDIRNTPAWVFLERRGVDLAQLPPDIHRALRWHPACPWERGRHGCMVALFTDAITGEPRAIHRTAITPTGEKVDRKALGPSRGCVIRLWPDECVTDGLIIGEGIETILSTATCIEHSGTLLQPAWATTVAGNLKDFPVLSGIEALTILVDNDASETGQKAALECSARWTKAGREVTRLIPRKRGSDFNDLIHAGRRQ